ncbi:hypothetical protein BDP27DRAFT_1323539, partial [Rhodocollybia butyracea]
RRTVFLHWANIRQLCFQPTRTRASSILYRWIGGLLAVLQHLSSFHLPVTTRAKQHYG